MSPKGLNSLITVSRSQKIVARGWPSLLLISLITKKIIWIFGHVNHHWNFKQCTLANCLQPAACFPRIESVVTRDVLIHLTHRHVAPGSNCQAIYPIYARDCIKALFISYECSDKVCCFFQSDSTTLLTAVTLCLKEESEDWFILNV